MKYQQVTFEAAAEFKYLVQAEMTAEEAVAQARKWLQDSDGPNTVLSSPLRGLLSIGSIDELTAECDLIEANQVGSKFDWKSSERWRDILVKCMNVHGDTGKWEQVPEILVREKSKLEGIKKEMSLVLGHISEYEDEGEGFVNVQAEYFNSLVKLIQEA